MPSGGKRVRSGPAKDPNSEKSRRLGYTLQSLPNTECRMKPPEWPLEPADDERVRRLEAEKWKWLGEAAHATPPPSVRLWKLPQARAWHLPQFKWMIHELALYARLSTACEIAPAPTALTVLLRISDRVGMSAAGLQALGWKIEAEAERKPVDSEFTRRRAKELNRESAAERSPMDETRHVYQRRMSGNG